MPILRHINALPRRFRWSIKVFLAIILLVLVCYPRLDRFVVQLDRYFHADRLVKPDSPALDSLAEEFDHIRQPDWDRQRLFKELERFVRSKISYEWDWNLWGNVDYWPTVEEVVAAGREDCDGRAIVAASMYQRYGFKSKLVADLVHVWVDTDFGEAMGPRKTQGVQFTSQGWKINWKVLQELPTTICYGFSVFPLWRELILLSGWWLLCISRGAQFKQLMSWLILLWFSLMLVREGGRDLRDPGIILNWSGIGLALLAYGGTIARSRSRQHLIDSLPQPEQ